MFVILGAGIDAIDAANRFGAPAKVTISYWVQPVKFIPVDLWVCRFLLFNRITGAYSLFNRYVPFTDIDIFNSYYYNKDTPREKKDVLLTHLLFRL